MLYIYIHIYICIYIYMYIYIYCLGWNRHWKSVPCVGQLIKRSQQMKKYFTRTNLTIFGSIPHILRASPHPPCLSSSTVISLFGPWLLFVYSALHMVEHPQFIALYYLICSSLFFITICPWNFCPASPQAGVKRFLTLDLSQLVNSCWLTP